MARIEVKIKPNGEIIEHVVQVQGEECVKLTRPLEKALGQVVSRQYEMEFFEQAVTGTTEVQKEQQTT